MSVKIDFSYQNAEGQGISGASVELWTGDGGAGESKIDDATDHGNGNYSMEYSVSGKYTIKVNGTAVPSMTNRYLPADDLLKQGHVDGTTLEFVDIGSGVYNIRVKAGGVDTLQLKDDSVTKDKVAADVAGDGLKQNANGSLSPDPDGSTIEVNGSGKLAVKDNVFCEIADLVNDLTTGGTNKALTAEQGKTLKNLIGSLSFSEVPYLKYLNSVNVSNALINLAFQISSITNTINNGNNTKETLVYSEAVSGTPPEDSDFTDYEVASDEFVPILMGTFYKRAGDTLLSLFAEGKIAVGDGVEMRARLKALGGLWSITGNDSTAATSASYTDIDGYLDISSLEVGKYKWEIEIKGQKNSADTIRSGYLRKPHLIKT